MAGTLTDVEPKADPAASGLATWWRWVAANAAGELIGLGGTALIVVSLFQVFGSSAALAIRLLMALAMILAGTFIEGMAVGIAQGVVLRHAIPALQPATWIKATCAGTGIAWFLGSLPSTLMDLGSEPAAGSAVEISDVLVYTLAALMGLLLGPILSGVQWLVLRKHLPQAWVWIPAHSLAWAVGMPLIFLGVSLASASTDPATAILSGILVLALAGAAVGAIHGIALIWLLHKKKQQVARHRL